MSRSQVEDIDAVQLLHALDCLDMALRQVDDMDIVADSRSVGSIIVVAEYVDLLQLAGSHLGHVREQVVGNSLGIFSDHAALVRSDRVKIAKQHDFPAIVRFPYICEDPLLHGLCLAVRIGRDALGALLCDRDKSGISVDGRRGREYDLEAAVLSHGLAERQRGAQVVLVVFDRLSRGFTDRLVSCEVNDRVDLLFLKKGVQRGLITDIQLVECRALAGDRFDPVDHHSL